ncbi:MAG: NAD(P)H-hydrate epimerase [Actinomycetia bacterium]|nr:NAD(P)H-hydrate epimerase [Actinomycetes bacterium]
MIPATVAADIPYLSTDQMIEVDRAMIEDYHIDLVRMMENAGRNLAHLARERFLDGDPRGRHVIVLAGTGGNGGGALVAARRLRNYGAAVSVFTTKPDNAFSLVPGQQLDLLRRMDVTIGSTDAVESAENADLVLDGVIGYSLRGAPRGNAGALIRWANAQSSPVLSLDAPSGIDTTTGTIFDPAIRATATITLALPKEGLRTPGVQAHVGELYLADISVPPELYKRFLGIDVGPIFAESDILQIVQRL